MSCRSRFDLSLVKKRPPILALSIELPLYATARISWTSLFEQKEQIPNRFTLPNQPGSSRLPSRSRDRESVGHPTYDRNRESWSASGFDSNRRTISRRTCDSPETATERTDSQEPACSEHFSTVGSRCDISGDELSFFEAIHLSEALTQYKYSYKNVQITLIDNQEYVVAPWGIDGCETENVTVELPARDLVAQLEVPEHVLERMMDLGEKHGISPEQALSEALERNRARISLMAAQSVSDTSRVQEHLTEAREFLDGVDTLDTTEIDTKIEHVWNNEIGLP